MRRTASAAIIFLLFLWGCSRERGRSEQKAEPKVVEGVEVEAIQRTPVEGFFEAVGTVASRKTTALSSKVVGTIVSISVTEGDRVSKGQTLVEIDSRELHAELQGAEAAYQEVESALKAAQSAVVAANGQRDLAAATFKRYESLIARGSVTPQEFDEVSARYKVADAEAARAEENLRALRARKEQARAKVSYAQTLLSYTRISSPYDGLVTAKTAEIGMVASPGTSLLRVEEGGRYRLETQVGESWLGYVRIGDGVPVMIDALKVGLSGRVGEIIPAADPQSRTFTVKIDLPLQARIRSGLYGKARFSLGKKEVLLVPSEALLQRGQLVGLYVVGKEGLARFRLVKTGKRYGDRMEILSGLNVDERIVTKGAERVSDGSRIAGL